MEYNIDIQRLHRNYLELPLKRGEVADINDLKYLYLELNMSKPDICKYLNISTSRFQRMCHSYGLKKTNEQIQELAKKGLGSTSAFTRSETHLKAQRTKQKRYGDKTYNNKKKAIETNLKRYGVGNPTQRFYSEEQLELLNNKNKLIQYINDNSILNIIDLYNHIGTSYKTLQRTINKFDLYYLFDYTKSNLEREIKDFINQYYKTENNVKILDGKEIDIYIPEKKIGIEVNGDFYHNEYGKDKLYHQQKSLLAEDKGIFLYHIFEYEWVNKKEQIINQLKNLLGVNKNKIYARNCVIKEVSIQDKNEFLKLNHLQGDDLSKIKLGLYYNNELVSIMTFSQSRFTRSCEWELSRFASKADCNVIGGASKLFKHFIKKYNPKSIVSYSNIAHTRGNLYSILGFQLNNISLPNYVWAKHTNILTRYQCQKKHLIEQGFTGSSETDIMHKRDYYRIFDCGNKVWIWKA